MLSHSPVISAFVGFWELRLLFFFFFKVLGILPRALHLETLYHSNHISSPFVCIFLFLRQGLPKFAQQPGTCNPPASASE
jgi:hypothetical protein